MYFGPAKPDKISYGDLLRQRALGTSGVALLCDFGKSLRQLEPVFRALSGKRVRLMLHTGPY